MLLKCAEYLNMMDSFISFLLVLKDEKFEKSFGEKMSHILI